MTAIDTEYYKIKDSMNSMLGSYEIEEAIIQSKRTEI